MNCSIYTDMLTAYTDNLLSKEDTAKLLHHLKSCANCRQIANMQKLASKAFSDIRILPAPDVLKSAVLEEIDRAMPPSRKSWWRRTWVKIAAGAAAVAVVAFCANLFPQFSLESQTKTTADRGNYMVAATAYSPSPPASSSYESTDTLMPAAATPPAGRNESGYSSGAGDMPIGAERKISYTASLSLEVTNYDHTVSSIRQIASVYGGYISYSNSGNVSDNLRRGSVTVKVNSAFFDAAIGDIKVLGSVENESLQSNDMTSEYYDREGRLRQYRLHEERLLTIMATAGTVEELLSVESALSGVRMQIDSLEGSLRYMDELTELAEIGINLTETDKSTQTIAPSRWSTLGKDISKAFLGMINRTLNGAAGLLVLLTEALPWLILAAIIIIGIILFTRSRRKKKE